MTEAHQTALDPKETLLEAILPHVPFDGWTEEAFRAAVADSGFSDDLARVICPRGAVELALAYHERGDAMMLQLLADADLADMRFRDRIAAAVRFRLEVVEDKELVRRGMTLFALPQYAADGAKALWGTCDAIWDALGDPSEDINWYTKRMTLSAVYSTTVLFWLGDESPLHEATWEFLDRRIDNVMQFEKVKAQVRKNPLLKPFMAVQEKLTSHIRKPATKRSDLPGSFSPRYQETE